MTEYRDKKEAAPRVVYVYAAPLLKRCLDKEVIQLGQKKVRHAACSG